MSTQYNAIQAPYDAIRKTSIALIEYEQVRNIITPYIEDALILELACGSGFYTSSFIKWGARAVVGVEISSAMLEEARQQAAASGAISKDKNIEFHLGDCSKPKVYPGGPFDIVFGAWLLNYAPDRAGLVDMFRNIEMNLKPGGVFVGVTPPPTQDPRAHVLSEIKARPLGSGTLFFSNITDVEDGVHFHIHADTEVGAVDFDNYHLRKEVYEEAAREARLKGRLIWRITIVPERYLRGEGEGGMSVQELKSYAESPHYGILVVAK